MRRVGKTGWTLFLIQCAAVALLFGGYFGLKANISELKAQVKALDQRLTATEQTFKDGVLPPAHQTAPARMTVEPIQLGGAPKQAPSNEKREAARDDAHDQPAVKSVAQAIAETLVCVDKNTHTVFPCENAANCLGPKGFEPTYFNGLRTKLGITTPMMICNLKSTENAIAPATE